jgi:hypothetical protein
LVVRLPRSTAIIWARFFRLAPLRNGIGKAMCVSYMFVFFLKQAAILARRKFVPLRCLSSCHAKALRQTKLDFTPEFLSELQPFLS